MSTLIVGLCGAARSGKTTVAGYLVERYGSLGVRQFALADALKVELFDFFQSYNMAADRAFLPETGLPLIPYDRVFEDSVKISFIDENKERLRSWLQEWGTSYRRAQNPDYWIDRVLERIAEESPRVALLTDVRFLNELAICHVAVKVEKLGQREDAAVAAHVSEQEWRVWNFRENVVRAGEGDLRTLRAEAERVFEGIVKGFRVQ